MGREIHLLLEDGVVGRERRRGGVLEGGKDLAGAEEVEEGGGGREESRGREEEDALVGGGDWPRGKVREEEKGEANAKQEVVPYPGADDSKLGEWREGGKEGGVEEDVGTWEEAKGEVDTKGLISYAFFDGPPSMAPFVDEEGE